MEEPQKFFTKYEKIAEEIRISIRKNTFFGGKLPPERELASEFKTNRLTLRKALALLEKEKLIYRDSTRGTFIGRKKTGRPARDKVIALVLVGRSRVDLLHSGTIFAIEQKIKNYHSQLMLFSVSSKEEIEQVLCSPVNSRIIDAFILTGLVTPEIALKVRELGVPVILFGHFIHASNEESAFDRVYPDSTEYGYYAVRHLIEKGKRKIALINGPSYQWFFNLLQGYLRALDEAKIEVDEELIEKTSADNEEGGKIAFERLISKEKDYDALLVANGRLLAGVYESINENQNLSIKDIPIITITSSYAKVGVPGVESVVIDWDIMVNSALELLFKRLQDMDKEPEYVSVPFIIEKSE